MELLRYQHPPELQPHDQTHPEERERRGREGDEGEGGKGGGNEGQKDGG